MRALPITLLGTLLVGISGCFITPGSGPGNSIACTDLYTEGGLAITVRPPALATPDRYRLQVRAAGDTLSLDYDLGAGASAECVAPCEDEGALFILSQGLRQADGAMFGFVTDNSRSKGPATAVVQVFRGSTEVYQQAVTPNYRTTEPNGAGCGEVSNADFTVTLP